MQPTRESPGSLKKKSNPWDDTYHPMKCTTDWIPLLNLGKGKAGAPNTQYLVQMKIVPEGRPKSVEEGEVFFKEFIHPTLELCKKLQDEEKILAGGPISGTIGLALVVQADSAKELDDLVTSLPV
jgi:hypothetical protein